MPRDEAMNRLLTALRRDHPDRLPEDAARAMEAYASGDYAAFLEILAPLAAPTNARAFARLQERAANGYGTAAEALLGALLVRE